MYVPRRSEDQKNKELGGDKEWIKGRRSQDVGRVLRVGVCVGDRVGGKVSETKTPWMVLFLENWYEKGGKTLSSSRYIF